MFVAGKVDDDDDDDDDDSSGDGGEDNEDQPASKILDVMEHRKKKGNTNREVVEHPEDHPSHHGILSALAFLDRAAALHGLVYRLAFGSLLGQTRGGRIIPHDTDADTVVTYDALVRKMFCRIFVCLIFLFPFD